MEFVENIVKADIKKFWESVGKELDLMFQNQYQISIVIFLVIKVNISQELFVIEIVNKLEWLIAELVLALFPRLDVDQL